MLREALAALLRTASGFKAVVLSHDLPEAGRLVSHPSVILWDVTTGGDPKSTIRELGAACPPPAPILLLGPPTDGATLADILHAGATGYVTTESTFAELVALLRQAARGEPAISPGLAVSLFTQLAAAGPAAAREGPPLTERELQVLRLVASGATNKQIAQRLYLSVRTVEGHLANLYGKLGVNSRTEAALVAMRRGWATP